MRVFFGPSTKGYSLRLHRALAGALDDAPASVRDRYRVEAQPARPLADRPAVRLADARRSRRPTYRTPTRPSAGKTAVRREDELDVSESPPPAETWDVAAASLGMDPEDEVELEESAELDTEGWSELEGEQDLEPYDAGESDLVEPEDEGGELDVPLLEDLDVEEDLDWDAAQALSEDEGAGSEVFGDESEAELDADTADIAERVAAALARGAGTRRESELQVPRARWTTCFSAADATRAIQTFESNVAAADAASHDRSSCIVMLNVAIGALLELRTKSWPARGYKQGTMPRRPRRVQMAALTTETIELAMRQLVRAGRATGPLRIDFTDRRGRRAGTLAPVALASSVLDAITARTADPGCWYAFGMSLMDGFHSVLLLVDRTGPTRRIYWMDQFSRGLDREVTTTLDAEITTYTQNAWAGVLRDKGKRFNTPVRLWRLRRRVTP